VSSNWGHAHSTSGYGTGGTWNALMWCAKMIATNGTMPPRDIPTPLVPTKVDALITKWATKPPPPNITTGPKGINIPAAAFTSKHRTA
jgi:hypothetical protein